MSTENTPLASCEPAPKLTSSWGGPSRKVSSLRRQANKKIDKLAGVMYRIL